MKRNRHLAPPPGVPHDRHLAREWMTMGLYVSISLLAAIGTLVQTGHGAESPIRALWGILLGLVVAHWFAFSLAAIATDTGEGRREALLHSAAGVAGAASVGVALTLTSWLVPATWETAAITVVLIAYIALAAVTVARSRQADWFRTGVIVAAVLALSLGIVLLKNFLGDH
ncbi:hypothetical protein [Thiobacillus sp.]|uniref:hypothetical protein n=1 Tax=Thiobacillus sp. TaxID=924 RepID=UPI0025FF7ED4|nr:hypothetical protein [Thiobacillus sp.]